MAIPKNATEQDEFRREETVTREWGKGIVHTRRIKCARKKSDDLILNDMAPGTLMPEEWLWDDSRDTDDIGYPRIQGEARVIDKQGGRDIIEVQYLEVVHGGTASGAYVESNREWSELQYGIEYTISGIATATGSTGIPAIGDVLDSTGTWLAATAYTTGQIAQGDGSPDSYFYIALQATTNNEPPNTTYWNRVTDEPFCYRVDRDDHVLLGIILVRSLWREERNFA